MNEDEQVEKEDNLKANEEKLQNAESHNKRGKSFAANARKINPARPKPVVLRLRGPSLEDREFL
jgi:hypothetical protein